MPKRLNPYRTFPLLPLLSGFVVFISTVVVAMISLTQSRYLSLSGSVSVISNRETQVPVIVTSLKNRRTTLEIVGAKSKELIYQQGKKIDFTGRLRNSSGPYGTQFEVTSYSPSLK